MLGSWLAVLARWARPLHRLFGQVGPQAMLHNRARSLAGLPALAGLQDMLWNLARP